MDGAGEHAYRPPGGRITFHFPALPERLHDQGGGVPQSNSSPCSEIALQGQLHQPLWRRVGALVCRGCLHDRSVSIDEKHEPM